MELVFVLDCRDPDQLAEFWGPALHYREARRVGRYLVLAPGPGQAGPELLLQQVPEPKTTKNRMHLDIRTPEMREEAERLQALGGKRTSAEPVEEHSFRWIVMADPEDNEFCVVEGP